MSWHVSWYCKGRCWLRIDCGMTSKCLPSGPEVRFRHPEAEDEDTEQDEPPQWLLDLRDAVVLPAHKTGFVSKTPQTGQ
eukprot:5462944-Amphidinium_carterae.2